MKYIIILLFSLSISYIYSQNTPDSIKHMFINDSIVNNLPVYDISSEILLFSNTFKLYKNDIYSNNLQIIDNSIYIDDIPLFSYKEFPFRIVSFTDYSNNIIINNAGYNLTGGYFFNIKQPSDSLSITIDLRKDFPRFLSNNLHEKIPNIMEGNFEIDGTIKISPGYKLKYLFLLGLNNNEEPFLTNSVKTYLDDDKINSFASDPISIYAPYYTIPNTELVNSEDFSQSNFIKGDNIKDQKIFGKIIIPINKRSGVTIGNYSIFKNGKDPVYQNMMMNWANNPDFREHNIVSYIKADMEIFKSENINIKCYLNAAYTDYKKVTENKNLGKNYFLYGYYGNYKTYKTRSYSWTDTIQGYSYGVWQQDGFFDTLFTYSANEYSNTYVKDWNNEILNIYPSQSIIYPEVFQSIGGLLNGDSFDKVYNLWNQVGTPVSTYSMNKENNWTGSAYMIFSFKNSEINIGGNFCKKKMSGYSLYAEKLWTLARRLTNFHIQELDISNPHLVYDENNCFQDTIYYDRLYHGDYQTYFDYNLRKSLGIPYNSTEWIDLDNISPTALSINMFAPDELLMNNEILSAYGYDYTGKKISEVNFADFFILRNEDGVYTRPRKGFEPLSYNFNISARYKNIKWLRAEAGVNLNAYNSNQPVIEDPYSVYKIKKAGEVTTINGQTVNHPGNIGSNYAVYVNNIFNPTEILGYRNGENWFDYNGNNISYLTYPAQPYLVNYDVYSPTFYSDNFTMSKTNYRIFPFLNLNLLFGKYILSIKYYSNSQNPGINSAFDPVNYLNQYMITNKVYSNSLLKPEYSNCFESVINYYPTRNTNIGISYLQSWFHDVFDITKYYSLIPYNYFTYYNNPNTIITHGITFFAGLNKVFKTPFSFGGSLCLQEHTENTKSYLLYFPNTICKSWFIYDADYSTHRSSFIYKNITKHMSFSILLNYRKMSNFVEELSDVYYKNSILRAGKNNYNLNLQIQKRFYPANIRSQITIYAIIENIFNKKNELFTYYKTGNAEDDGYLSNPDLQYYINSQNSPEAFRNYYRAYINNPYNYDIPRILRFGIKVMF